MLFLSDAGPCRSSQWERIPNPQTLMLRPWVTAACSTNPLYQAAHSPWWNIIVWVFAVVLYTANICPQPLKKWVMLANKRLPGGRFFFLLLNVLLAEVLTMLTFVTPVTQLYSTIFSKWEIRFKTKKTKNKNTMRRHSCQYSAFDVCLW